MAARSDRRADGAGPIACLACIGFRLVAAGALALAGWPAIATAQPAIASDRPGLGSGAFVLDRSTTHIEAGVEVASGGGCRRARLEQSVVRWGVPGVEIQALLHSIVVRRVGGVTSTGMEDLGLGLKVPVARADGGLRVAVLGTLSLPTGARFVTSDEPVPAAALLVDRELSDRVSVSANVGYAAGPGDVDGVTSVTVSPSVVLHPRAAIGAFVGAGVALRWGAR